jgi:surfeit locus 1 family protein
MRIPVRETIITASCLAILMSLGGWQLNRLEWKTALIERLENAYAKNASGATLTEKDLGELSTQSAPIHFGTIHGRFLRDKAILLGPKTHNGKIGYQLIVPIQTNKNVLLVNAGWVSDLWKDTFEERLSMLPNERIVVTGIIRKPDWNSFTSKNSPANDLWFRADIGEISITKNLESTYPFIIYADSAKPELQDVVPHERGWLPRNKHFDYALFWFSMATVLAGVYGFYLFGMNKKKAL